MNDNRKTPKAPTNHDELAALLFAPSRHTMFLPTTTTTDDDREADRTARAFLGMTSATDDEDKRA